MSSTTEQPKDRKPEIDNCPNCGKEYFDVLGVGKCYDCFHGHDFTEIIETPIEPPEK